MGFDVNNVASPRAGRVMESAPRRGCSLSSINSIVYGGKIVHYLRGYRGPDPPGLILVRSPLRGTV